MIPELLLFLHFPVNMGPDHQFERAKPPRESRHSKMNNLHTWLLTKSSQRLSELILINKSRIVSVVGPEDVLPVCDVFPHPSKLVEVHSTFIFSIKHGWKRGGDISFTMTYLVEGISEHGVL